MRRRIAWLVAATTSAVVLAFIIPLCLLVRTMAVDRGLANANQEARNVAILVSGLQDDPRLPDLVDAVDRRSPARTSVLASTGQVLGAPDPAIGEDPAVRRALTGEAFTEVDDSGGEILVPVVTVEGTHVVRTTVSSDELHRGVTAAWFAIGALGLLLLLIAVLIADRIGRRVSTPVSDLARVAHRLREGDLDARVELSGTPETRELGHALNGLAERVIELLAAERTAVGDLSHRLRTPVTALRLDAEAVEQKDVADRLQVHTEHLQRTIDAIVKAARRPVRNNMRTWCDATATVRERVGFWSALAEDQGRRFEARLPATPEPVAVDGADLRDIVDILVDNVFAHTPEATPFSIELANNGGRPVLVVSDEGPGMAPRSSGNPERSGVTGLGLQIVRRSVGGFGGDLRTHAEAGQGTRIEVWLPPVAHAPGPRARRQSSSGSEESLDSS